MIYPYNNTNMVDMMFKYSYLILGKILENNLKMKKMQEPQCLLQYLRNEAVAVFASLINHEKIGDDEIFNECICRVVISAPRLLEKVGYPSQNNHETCHFSQHDYDDDNDFSHAFTREIQFDQYFTYFDCLNY